MKRILALSIATAVFATASASAQRDVEPLMKGNSLTRITSSFGQPLEFEEFEGDCGRFVSVLYPGFHATLYKDGSLSSISIWDNDFRILSTVTPGGIKVGDRISDFQDMDFTALLTGKHYESNGLIPLEKPFVIHPDGRIFNYGILSKGIPFHVFFAVEDGMIREMNICEIDDYTICDPATGKVMEEEMRAIQAVIKRYFDSYKDIES